MSEFIQFWVRTGIHCTQIVSENIHAVNGRGYTVSGTH